METDAERLIEDLLRETLYGTGEVFDAVVESVEEEAGGVWVRLRGEANDFQIVVPERADRHALAAQLERKLRVAREGPDMTRPPIG